jgi:hypothetical protein
MLKQDKNGYYLVESPADLRYWYKMSDLTTREKLQLKAEMNPPKVKTKKPNPKQMDGVESDKPFVKTRKTTKKVERPEPTAFDKWFN